MPIADNLRTLRDKLNAFANQYARDISSIRVMAVSKTRSASEIVEAREAGITDFGENRVEEASAKFASLDAAVYPLYFIGHLQSNKASRIDTRYQGVYSVDSVRIATRLSRYRATIGKALDVLLQVNTSGERSKSGFVDPVYFLEAAEEIAEMPFLILRGVMTMAPFVDDEKMVRKCFSSCRSWYDNIAGCIAGEPILSMGMSSDYRWAVAEGSNHLRLGTAIFGDRQ